MKFDDPRDVEIVQAAKEPSPGTTVQFVGYPGPPGTNSMPESTQTTHALDTAPMKSGYTYVTF